MSQVVEVKGTTIIGLTVPHLLKTPWSTRLSPRPTLFIKAINGPVGASLPTESTVTVVVFRGGGPDSQFALPIFQTPPPLPPPTHSPFTSGSVTLTLIPKTQSKPPRPSDLQEEPEEELFQAQTALSSEFSKPFPSFVPGVRLFLETGSSMTETSNTPSDLFKRVSSQNTDVPDLFMIGGPATQHPYINAFSEIFHFWRGSYRVYATSIKTTGTGSVFALTSAIYAKRQTISPAPETIVDAAFPLLPLRRFTVVDGLHVTIPWMATVPYFPISATTLFPFDAYDRQVCAMNRPPVSELMYVAAGDDFVMGHVRSPRTPIP